MPKNPDKAGNHSEDVSTRMIQSNHHFELRFAETPEDVEAVQRLRYSVFVQELGAAGPGVDHGAGLECDRFDAFADHLMLIDHARGSEPVGVYRAMTEAQAKSAGQFYSEDEYDLSALKSSGKRVMELGRSCLHPDYRGGTAMMHLWQGVADHVQRHQIDLLIGVASFQGCNLDALAAPLSLLHHRHLAPDILRPVAKPPGAVAMDRMPEDQIDRKRATCAIPSLIKAYLRFGGMVGQGAFVDPEFNCTDIALVLDTAQLSAKHRAIYAL